MRAHDERRARVEQFPERGSRRRDPEVVRDPPVLQRDVQIAANEDPPARDVAEVLERPQTPGAHSLDAMSSTSSTRRFEYPHSLSYHPTTLTRLPMAMVRSESNVHDAGEPTMSEDTMGASRSPSLPAR